MKKLTFWTIPKSPDFKMFLIIPPALLAMATDDETIFNKSGSDISKRFRLFLIFYL